MPSSEPAISELASARRTARIAGFSASMMSTLSRHDCGVAGERGGHPDLGAAPEQSVEPRELRFEHVAERARVPLGLSLDLDFPVTAEVLPDEQAQAGAEHQDHEDRDGAQPFGAAVFVGHHR